MPLNDTAIIRGVTVGIDTATPDVPFTDASQDGGDVVLESAAHLSHMGLANNIGSHGGIPNGVYDCRAALIACLDAAEAAEGDVDVFIPAGRWKVSARLIDAQDESDYDAFAGGTGYSEGDALMLSNGDTVNVDAVSGGVVIEFTVNSSGANAAAGGDVLTATGGTGNDDFSMTLAGGNVEAIKHAFSSKLRICGPGTLLIDGLLLFQTPNGSQIEIDDVKIEPTHRSIHGVHIRSSDGTTTTTLVGDARVGAETFAVASGNGINDGDLMWIRSTAAWPSGDNTVVGETQTIRDITGATITPEAPLYCPYDDASDTINVNVRTPVRVTLKDVRVDYGAINTDSGLKPIGVKLEYAADSRIENIYVRGAPSKGLELKTCVNVATVGGNIVESFDDALGYGVQVQASTHCSFTGLNTSRCRRGVDYNGLHPNHGCSEVGGVRIGLDTQGSCCGNHAASNLHLIDGVTMIGGDHSVTIRGPNTTVRNCHMLRPNNNYINYDGGPGCVIEGNVAGVDPLGASDANLVADGSNGEVFVSIDTASGSVSFDTATYAHSWLVIRNNVATVNQAFVQTRTGASAAAWRRVLIEGNVANLLEPTGTAETEFLEFQAASQTFSDVIIRNNHVFDVRGDFAIARHNTIDWSNVLFEGNTGGLASQTLTASGAAIVGIPIVMNGGSAIAVTLDDGVYEGQRQPFVNAASNVSTLAATNHVDSDTQYCDQNEGGELHWLNDKWHTGAFNGSTAGD